MVEIVYSLFEKNLNSHSEIVRLLIWKWGIQIFFKFAFEYILYTQIIINSVPSPNVSDVTVIFTVGLA